MLLAIVWQYKKLNLAVAITKTSSLFIQDNPSAIFLPVIVFLIVLVYILYWIGVALLIYSIGTVNTAA